MICAVATQIAAPCITQGLTDPGQSCLQAYPWVVRRILCSNSSGSMSLLRDILYDSSGNVKPTRLSALLNAALGYVSDEVDGFVDFDAVPEEGASAQVSLW